jgi:hypothetical protein
MKNKYALRGRTTQRTNNPKQITTSQQPLNVVSSGQAYARAWLLAELCAESI